MLPFYDPKYTQPEDELFRAQVEELRRRCQAAETRVQLLEGLLREALPLVGVDARGAIAELTDRIDAALAPPAPPPTTEEIADSINAAIAVERAPCPKCDGAGVVDHPTLHIPIVCPRC